VLRRKEDFSAVLRPGVRTGRPALLLDVDNGVTLCRSHHNYFHTRPDEFRKFVAIIRQKWVDETKALLAP
jgi:hypothetical protein